MGRMKTAELKDAALDWAVAKAKGETVTWEGKGTHAFLTTSEIRVLADWDTAQEYSPSTDWSQGGPLIERERISIEYMAGAGDAGLDVWVATRIEGPAVSEEYGLTPLVAAMRCYVASKLGDEVDIPKELTWAA